MKKEVRRQGERLRFLSFFLSFLFFLFFPLFGSIDLGMRKDKDKKWKSVERGGGFNYVSLLFSLALINWNNYNLSTP